MAGTDHEEVPLSPRVAELIERVKAKMAQAPTIDQIRELSEPALDDPARDALTLAEIRQLTDVAIGKARSVEGYAARLASLLTDGDR